MKKLCALFTALLLIAALATGCGGTTSSQAASTGGTTPQGTDAGGSAPSQEQSEPVNSDAEYDNIQLTFSTTYNEGETLGQVITYFTSYITEASGGAVTFNIMWGGTLAGTGEEMEFLQSGAFDMAVIGQSQYTDILPLLNFPGWANESQKKAIDYFNYIVYENEETASLIQPQIEALNVVMLGATSGGSNSFATKQHYTTLEEMKGLRLGVGMNQSAFETLGFTVQNMMPWDGYDNLSKGVVDCAYMATAPMVSLSWYEVAPNFLLTGTYAAGNYWTINLDKWNSMNADTQALFREAASASQVHSIELFAQQEAAVADTLEAAGGQLGQLNAADEAAYMQAMFDATVIDCRSYAAAAGCSDEMEIILTACSEYLGIDF